MKQKEHKTIDGIECKHCFNCNQWKELKEFNKNKRNWDGLRRQCKECCAKYRQTPKAKKNQRKHSKKCISTPQRKEQHKKYLKEYNKRPHILKRNNIRSYTNRALGSAKQFNCMICNKQGEEYHHFSYGKDYKVNIVVLCIKCHKKLHRGAGL